MSMCPTKSAKKLKRKLGGGNGGGAIRCRDVHVHTHKGEKGARGETNRAARKSRKITDSRQRYEQWRERSRSNLQKARSAP